MTVTEYHSDVLSTEPLHPTIGAVVNGVDAKRPLDEATIEFVRRALVDFKVIFLRAQHLDFEEQNRFARYFGDIFEHPIQTTGKYPDLEWLAQEGVSVRADGWHSDVVFVPEPPFGSILTVVEQPPLGGDTLFADLEAAYHGLSEPVRRLVDELTVLHDGANFQDWAWGPDVDETWRNQILQWSARKVEHSLVRFHPDTGRKSLYAVTGNARKIKGLSEEESSGILSLLAAYSTRPEYVVRFKWQPGDLAFWDNRRVLHRVSNDWGDAPRRLQRVTISQRVPTASDLVPDSPDGRRRSRLFGGARLRASYPSP